MSEPTHWITSNPDGDGNVTACGRHLVFPMRGNGWRVSDVDCPDCNRAICDHLHEHKVGLARNAA